MKKIIDFVLLLYCVTNPIHSQSKINQIGTHYFQIDSVSYLKSLENAVIESVIIDFRKPLEAHIKERYYSIKNGIENNNVKFVLNVEIDTTKLKSENYDYLEIDLSHYNFNIYCFDKKNNPVYFIYFYDGMLNFFGDFYPTFSKSYSKQIRLAFKNILKKKPQYLLNCNSLPNTILYIKDEKIYVYRVKQKEEYELDVYVKRFWETKDF